MMYTLGNFLIGCILAVCALVVLVVLMIEPAGRSAFVHDYLGYLTTAAVLVVVITLAFASILKWS